MSNQSKATVDMEVINPLTVAWNKAKKALAKAQEAEKEARAELVAAGFPNGLLEGVNTLPLAGAWKLKVSGVVDRKIDAPALPSIIARMKERFPDVEVEDLVVYKPELSTKAYKELVKSNPKAAKLFDNALIIRGTGETSPQVKIEEAKR